MPIIFGSVIRHALSGLGAVLVSKGIAQPDVVESFSNSIIEIASGAVMFGFAQIWSIGRIKKLF